MDDLRSDEEQAEALKQWLKKNGTGLIVAILAGIGGVIGYQQWQQASLNKASDAAGLYQRVLDGSAIDFSQAGTEAAFQTLLNDAEALRQAHEDSNYSALAAAVVAAQAAERGDYDLAVSQLTFAESALNEPETKALVSLRLARLELHLGSAEDALIRVQSVETLGLEATRAELMGDIYGAMSRPSEARKAYQHARERLIESGISPALVDLKLSALPKE